MAWPKRRRRRQVIRAVSHCRRKYWYTPETAMHSPLLRCMWEIRRVLEREGIVTRAGLVTYLGESQRVDGAEGEAFSAGTVYQALHVLAAGGEVMLWRTSDPYETLVLHQNAPWTS